MIDVGKRGVPACWQHAGSEPVIAPELSSRDDTHFEVHRTFHVYDVQAQEERPSRFKVVVRQPLVKLSQQLVAGSQHPAMVSLPGCLRTPSQDAAPLAAAE